MRTVRYERVMHLLASGTIDELEEASASESTFPEGVDDCIGRRWIINALDYGSSSAIYWMLEKGVGLDFVDEEGRSPLLAVLERDASDRYLVLEKLLLAGAPVNKKGFNDYTPAHQAASWDDLEALKILIRYGADLSIRTDIDERATPLDIAKIRRSKNAAAYLRSVV